MTEIKTKPLMVLTLQVAPMQMVGAAPSGDRRVGVVTGGSFAGERLNGTCAAGWL